MREIRYRAQTRETSAFVYGIPFQNGCGSWFMPTDKGMGFCTEVIPETITISTGRKDKNDVEIFEGDIVKIPVAISDSTEEYLVMYNENTMAFELHLIYRAFNTFSLVGNNLASFFATTAYCPKEIEVVGNMYEDIPRLRKADIFEDD